MVGGEGGHSQQLITSFSSRNIQHSKADDSGARGMLIWRICEGVTRGTSRRTSLPHAIRQLPQPYKLFRTTVRRERPRSLLVVRVWYPSHHNNSVPHVEGSVQSKTPILRIGMNFRAPLMTAISASQDHHYQGCVCAVDVQRTSPCQFASSRNRR